jgi:hypothetical protein
MDITRENKQARRKNVLGHELQGGGARKGETGMVLGEAVVGLAGNFPWAATFRALGLEMAKTFMAN